MAIVSLAISGLALLLALYAVWTASDCEDDIEAMTDDLDAMRMSRRDKGTGKAAEDWETGKGRYNDGC